MTTNSSAKLPKNTLIILRGENSVSIVTNDIASVKHHKLLGSIATYRKRTVQKIISPMSKYAKKKSEHCIKETHNPDSEY